MKKNERNHALIINCKCHFSHMIMSQYNMAISTHFHRKYCKNMSYPIIIKGRFKEKGSKFIIKRTDLKLYVFYEITELIITDYYAFIKYHIYKTIPETYEYHYIVDLRYINEDQFDFFSYFIFDQNIYLSEKDMHEEIKFRKNLYKNIEKSLRDFEILKIVNVYTNIASNIELIFDVLKNMKMIHKYSRLLGDSINYNGNILKKNSIIYLKDISGKFIDESIAKVHKFILNESKECIFELLFKNENSLSEFSKNKIKIIIYEYSGSCTIHILYFFCKIQKNKEKFQKNKNNELIKFKKIIENYNKRNNNQFSK